MEKKDIEKILERMRENLLKLDKSKLTDDSYMLPEDNDIVVTVYKTVRRTRGDEPQNKDKKDEKGNKSK
jgi:hypothetical protein